MLKLSELEGKNKNLLLIFLRMLERRGMLYSKLENHENRTMRVWYGYQSSEGTTIDN